MLRLEIVTPERRVLDAEVDSVTVPTSSGEVGILSNHASLISAVKPGILTYAVKGSTDRLAVSGGFVEVSTDKVAVLVDSAESADEIDIAAAKAELDSIEKASAAAGILPVDEIGTSRDAIDHASARVHLASGK